MLWLRTKTLMRLRYRGVTVGFFSLRVEGAHCVF